MRRSATRFVAAAVLLICSIPLVAAANTEKVVVANTAKNPVPTTAAPDTSQYQFVTVSGQPSISGSNVGDIVPVQSQYSSYPTVDAVLTYLSSQGYELVSVANTQVFFQGAADGAWMIYTLRIKIK